MERVYVALDVETTGLQIGVDEIIEIGAVKFQGREVLETFSTCVSPRQSLPLKITRLTGITARDLASAPRFNDVAPKLVTFIRNYPLVGHSINFDVSMLNAQGIHFAQPVYDTFDLATLLLPQAPIYRLGALADHIGIAHPEDHRAFNDADVCRQVFLHLLDQMYALSRRELTEINRLAAKTNWSLRDLFEATLSERVRTAFTAPHPADAANADEHTPQHKAEQPTPLKPTGDVTPLDIRQITDFFGSAGPLGRSFPNYEQRPAQVDMAEAVANAFNNGDALIVEAGTGTGKSMAYLVPAALFAAQRGERVVISTNTLNLQDQLFFKDIPTLQNIMSSDTGQEAPFVAALLKGRGNYLCLRRYKQLRQSENLQPEEARMLLKVQLWLSHTQSGDRAELLLIDKEQAAWGKVNVTPDTCTGPRCSDFQDCYFFQARRYAETAHIVVVNHALLLSDLATENNVLPPYAHVIIDEAHNLEDAATDQLSFQTDQASLLQFFNDLYQESGAQIVGGLFSELRSYLRNSIATQEERDQVDQIAREILPAITRARSDTYECFNLITAFLHREVEPNHYDSRLRLTPGIRRKPEWETIEQSWGNLDLALSQISKSLGKLEALLGKLAHAELLNYDELVQRVESLHRFTNDVRIQMGSIVFGDAETITWITHDRIRDVLMLYAAPLSVADVLQGQLFAQKQTTVLASATLTVDGAFNFVKERIGLLEPEEIILDSPFDYERQALVYVPDDTPEPNQRGYQQMIEHALIQLCIATGGRTLALFTANSTLRQTYNGIQEALEEHEIAVLGQGIDGSRRTLLERFRESPRTVLLGTSSFWEGIDVVGEALSVLVITKLPFSVPTDPIFAARSEQFNNPFNEYAVPQSILRFKQGFGRLIRSKEDRGIVIVLDRRILTKKYGQQFLRSLPNTRVRTGSLQNLPTLSARFLV